MSRLTQPAQKDSKEFYVEPGLDWRIDDKVVLLPTSYDHKATDEVIIESYDAVTGKVTAGSALSYYHFGQA